MRKIAIVDDEQEERDSLQECFEQFQKENAIKLEIKTYCSGDVFLQQFVLILTWTELMELTRRRKSDRKTKKFLFSL